jgi:hypothetical protein
MFVIQLFYPLHRLESRIPRLCANTIGLRTSQRDKIGYIDHLQGSESFVPIFKDPKRPYLSCTIPRW